MTQPLTGFHFTCAFLTCRLLGQNADLAPQGTLRMVYLAGNAAQAVRDNATGQVSGVAADLTRELGRRTGLPVIITPLASPAAIIDAVSKGEADIGFVAYAPSRTGTVEFSQTYMLVRQTLLVPEQSSLHSVGEIDRPGLRIGGTKGDSITLYLGRILKRATLVETDGTTEDMKRKFEGRQIDAFGANRQRLTTLTKEMPWYRLLPDNILDVPQTIVVPKGRTAALATINALINDERQAGRLKASMEKSGVIGIDVAPAGYGYGKVE
jgi:polar amino acid transport system substrate-binding protein